MLSDYIKVKRIDKENIVSKYVKTHTIDIGMIDKTQLIKHGICRRLETDWENGYIIEGMYADDKLNGFARYINSQGGYYIGQWVNGL